MPAVILEWAELVVFMDQVPGDEHASAEVSPKKDPRFGNTTATNIII